VRWILAVSFLAVSAISALTPGAAWAQAGWYITPALSASEEFDDNVFSQTSQRESDFISRLSPSFKAGYQSKPLTLLISGGIDVEYFAEHPDLSGVANRKRAGLEMQYAPELATTIGLAAAYAETETPAELQPQTGIELGRRTTRLWSLSPSLSHRFNTRTSGEASYAYHEITSPGFTSVAQQAQLGISSLLSRLDTGRLRYTLGIIDAGPTSTTSHALTVGWVSKLSHDTVLSIDAGPRLSDGALQPEVSGTLSHRFKSGQVSLTYQRTETVVIGQAGTAETNSVLAALGLSLTRRLQMNLGAGFSDTTANLGADVLVYRASASLSYRLTKWLGISANYRFTRQEQTGPPLTHSIFSISLDAVYPIRMD
jgi:hypothetical protein